MNQNSQITFSVKDLSRENSITILAFQYFLLKIKSESSQLEAPPSYSQALLFSITFNDGKLSISKCLHTSALAQQSTYATLNLTSVLFSSEPTNSFHTGCSLLQCAHQGAKKKMNQVVSLRTCFSFIPTTCSSNCCVLSS